MTGTPKQARGAVTAIFFLNGLVFGEWAARIPAVRDRVGLSDGELGIVLACAAVGSILAMPVAGGRAARIGSRRATRVAFALMCLASGVIALAPSLLVLCLLAFFYGASMGSLDVTMNAHGVAVERRYGRSILASFHAAFSIGGLAGGVIGALAAAVGLDVRVQLAVVAVASAADRPDVVAALPRGRRRRDGPHRAGLRAPAAAAAGARRAGLRLPAHRGRVGRLERGLPARRARHHRGDRRHRLHRVQHHDDARARLRRSPRRSLRARGRRPRRRRPSRPSASASPLVAAAPVPAIVGFACLGAGMSGVVPIVFRAAGHVPGMSAGVGAGGGVEHRLPRLPRRPADHRRARRARRPARRARGGRRSSPPSSPLLAPTTRYARPGAPVAREPQTVAA